MLFVIIILSMNNLQISELLRNVASAYQYKDQNKYKFQIIAYQRAADAIEHSTSELKDLWDDNKLSEVPGVGPSIASHLDELFRTGKSKHFNEITKDIPEDAFKLMVLPKVGMKTAMKMLAELSKSEITEKLKEAERISNKVKRHLLPYAENIANEVIEFLNEDKDCLEINALGSLRRRVATVGDIDIAVSSNNPQAILDKFVKYKKAQKVIEKGTVTASILLPGDVQVDILVVKPENYGNALQHFTGSKHHNIALREYSLKRGYSMSEHGIKEVKTKKVHKFKDEVSLYNFLKLDYISPELREDGGEIEAAGNGKLPNLVRLEDIKSDLQIHSSFDIETSHDLGQNTMQEIIDKAVKLNYEYIAFTEHNPSRGKHTDSQIVKILKNKQEEVKKLSELLSYSGERSGESRVLKVFNSLEIDILKNGELSVPDKGLETLDFALVSIHSSFDLSRSEMTKRVIKALSHPKVKIFAHPTARKINEREGVELDWPTIFDFCLKNNKWIEVNADPMRLDLPDSLVRDAVKLGIKFTLGTDTHEISMMDNIKYGVDVLRRGWVEKQNVINSLGLIDFQKELERR